MKRARVSSARVVLAALVIVSSTGCSGGEVISAGEATVLVSEAADSGMHAAGGGRLEMLGGCLGADGVVVIWPHGTEIADDDPLAIDIPNNGTYGLGDQVEFGGGMVLEHSSEEVEPGPYEVAGVTVPAGCAKYDIFLAY